MPPNSFPFCALLADLAPKAFSGSPLCKASSWSPAGVDTTTDGRVIAQAYHGLHLMLHVATPLSPRPLAVRVTADQADRRPLAEGDPVTLGWNTADIRSFSE